MNEKIEIAKLTTELTVALLGDAHRRDQSLLFSARKAGEDKEKPDVLVLFDAIYNHLSSKLTPH